MAPLMLHSLVRLNKPEVAERYWLKALEVALEHMDTHYALAFRYNKMGRLDDAAQHWRTIIHWLMTARDISPAQEVLFRSRQLWSWCWLRQWRREKHQAFPSCRGSPRFALTPNRRSLRFHPSAPRQSQSRCDTQDN